LGIIDDPVSIKSVELFIVDEAYRRGWMAPRIPPIRTNKKVAIIGSGPAGLAAADELNRMGHEVTVYERAKRPGGLMMYGVPNMKADKADVVLQRTGIMEKEGIKFVCGKAGEVGGPEGPQAKELLDTNDAVLLATGSTIGRDLSHIPGRNLGNIHLAMEFLCSNTEVLVTSGKVDKSWRRAAVSKASVSESADEHPFGSSMTLPIDVAGKHVVVIGGGDTGNDCIGTSVRHGAASIVNLELMPKPPPSRAEHTPWPHWPSKFRVDYGHEEAAEMVNNGEDIRKYSVTTKEFIGDEHGKLKGVKIADLEWKHKDGRMQMSEVANSERILPADFAFLALGFLGPEQTLAQQLSVEMDKGRITAAFGKTPDAHRTSNPKVFAAGDCRRGQSLVVWGIAEGRAASRAVHNYIMSDPVAKKLNL